MPTYSLAERSVEDYNSVTFVDSQLDCLATMRERERSEFLPLGALGTKLTVLVLALRFSPDPSIQTYMHCTCGTSNLMKSSQMPTWSRDFPVKRKLCHIALAECQVA